MSWSVVLGEQKFFNVIHMKELIQQIIVDKLLQITVLNAFTIDQ